MEIALGVTEMCADENGKVKFLQGRVMKFDRKNTIDLPLVSNRKLTSKGRDQGKEETTR